MQKPTLNYPPQHDKRRRSRTNVRQGEQVNVDRVIKLKKARLRAPIRTALRPRSSRSTDALGPVAQQHKCALFVVMLIYLVIKKVDEM